MERSGSTGRLRGEGVELAFRMWPGEGEPVVALHGLTGTHMQFVGIAERLSPRRALFALDLRGRGSSDKPKGPYGVVQHARDVANAMRELGLKKSVVLGYSMGSFVAPELAASFPELVSGVMLLDGGWALQVPPGQSATAFMQSLLGPLVARLETTYQSPRAYLDFWRELGVFKPEEWGSWVEAWLLDDLTPTTPHRPRADVNAVRADFAELTDSPAVEARLKAMRQPISCVRAPWGTGYGVLPLFPERSLEGVRRCATSVTDLLVPGTNHYSLALCDPGASAVADALHAFASSCG